MKSLPIAAAIALAALLPVGPASAADGAALHQGNCVSCHGTEVYSRADRRVTTRPALNKQVHRCELALGLGWFDEDVEAVAQLLDDRHYKFK